MSTPRFYIWSDIVFNKVMQNTLTTYNLRPIRSDASSLSDIAKIIVECFSENQLTTLAFVSLMSPKGFYPPILENSLMCRRESQAFLPF